LFFSRHLFSTTSVALFLALFFQPSSVFNNFSTLFFGLLRFVFGARSCVINNFSALFFKKGILFVPFVSSVQEKTRSQALSKDYHASPQKSSKILRCDCPHPGPRGTGGAYIAFCAMRANRGQRPLFMTSDIDS
jgi:hypothetical protein